MARLVQMYQNIPPSLTTRYALAIYVFVGWMLFFDPYNVLNRWELSAEVREARQQKKYYQEETALIKQELTELFTDESTLEKFAREKYYMKRPDEDLFVIVEP
jgi:cell division protein FtsB